MSLKLNKIRYYLPPRVPTTKRDKIKNLPTMVADVSQQIEVKKLSKKAFLHLLKSTSIIFYQYGQKKFM